MIELWPALDFAVAIDPRPDPRSLAKIHEEGFSHSWSGADIAKLVGERSVLVATARRSGVLGSRPVGFAMARTAADEAEILSIAVRQRYRNRGIGAKLMGSMLRQLFRQRIVTVYLEVDSDNGAALNVYRKLGFEPVGERKGYYRQGRDKPASALVMRYDLR